MIAPVSSRSAEAGRRLRLATAHQRRSPLRDALRSRRRAGPAIVRQQRLFADIPPLPSSRPPPQRWRIRWVRAGRGGACRGLAQYRRRPGPRRGRDGGPPSCGRWRSAVLRPAPQPVLRRAKEDAASTATITEVVKDSTSTTTSQVGSALRQLLGTGGAPIESDAVLLSHEPTPHGGRCLSPIDYCGGRVSGDGWPAAVRGRRGPRGR